MSTDQPNGSGDTVLVLFKNIPQKVRSPTLRDTFASLINQEAFTCFHYKHRPMVNSETHATTSKAIALAEIKKPFLDCLLNDYDKRPWEDAQGRPLAEVCHIQILAEQFNSNDIPARFRSAEVDVQGMVVTRKLMEFNPPKDVMPNGNVGTPLDQFLQLIRECRLPPRLIKKLSLNFPWTVRKRIYSSVGFNYGHTEKPGSSTYRMPPKVLQDDQGPRIEELPEEAPEDWERHEALHKDVTEQERTKQRLYEDSEEMEVTWEKGGSGLVHYTDATYWDEEAGDFDEKTSDDWDVDMTYSDKDGRDWLELKRERQRHKPGKDDGTFPKKPIKLGQFKRPKDPKRKKVDNAYAERIMKKFGWSEGKGLGAKSQGIREPVDPDVQGPSDKRGLGYRGERLLPSQSSKNKDND